MIYTFTERTVKRHRAHEALTIAKLRLKGRPLCGNKFPTDNKALLTTEELNILVDALVDDSLFYSGAYSVVCMEQKDG